MAKKKISDLPAGSALTGVELLPIVQSGTTKKITAQDIANLGNASGVEGSGTIDYISKFTASSTIGDSIISDNGTRVTIDGDFRIALADANVNLQGSTKSYLLQVVDGNNRFRIYDNTANAERFTISSTGEASFSSSVTANSFIKSGGTSAQYLKADGSVSTLTNPITGTGTTNYLPKFTGTSALGNSTIFDNGTSVGIGTASPNAKLQVQNGTAANTLMQIQSFGTEAAGEYAGIQFKSAASNADEYTKSLLAFRNNGSGYGRGDLYFCLNDATTSANATLSDVKAVITSAGNVGIGTTSPARTLSVNGQIGLSDDLISTNSTNVARFGYNAYYASSGFNLTTENSIPLTFGTASAERMRIFSDGNIAINSTTNAGYKLDVNGTARVQGQLAVNHSLSGNYGAVIYNTSATGEGLVVRGGSTASHTSFTVQPYDGSVALFSVVATGAATFSSSVTVGNFTTTQINALTPAAGMVVLNTTLATLCFYDGSGWKKVSHSAM